LLLFYALNTRIRSDGEIKGLLWRRGVQPWCLLKMLNAKLQEDSIATRHTCTVTPAMNQTNLPNSKLSSLILKF